MQHKYLDKYGQVLYQVRKNQLATPPPCPSMSNSCGKCWTGFKRWLNAFTPLESLLTIIEAIFLILFIIFLVFLILHYLACGKSDNPPDNPHVTTPEITTPTPGVTKKRPKCTYTPDGSPTSRSVTVARDVDYEANDTMDAELWAADLSDGVLADDDERQVVLALVKVKPSGLTFGCIVTVVAEHWVVTAASCIDSIEEVDSLDNFVMLDDYGETRKGRSHTVSDVRVHPLYEGGNSSNDLALLKTDDTLKLRPVALPSLLEYYNMVIGDSAHLLGFGHFRSIDHSANGQRVHSATVHLLPARHCQVQRLEERHLVPMGVEAPARCPPAPMCLGVLYARGTPCNFCAGAPLLRRRTLLGVMADNGQCGAACEPARYANMAVAADWIKSVVGA